VRTTLIFGIVAVVVLSAAAAIAYRALRRPWTWRTPVLLAAAVATVAVLAYYWLMLSTGVHSTTGALYPG
jgi:hypothetical protein